MLKRFQAFLLRNRAVRPRYISYYLKWVLDCYHFLDKSLSNRLGSDQIKKIPRSSGNTPRGVAGETGGHGTATLRLFPLQRCATWKIANFHTKEKKWASLHEKMCQALRIRHRSLSTERTYLMWVRRFQAFVLKKRSHRISRVAISGTSLPTWPWKRRYLHPPRIRPLMPLCSSFATY